MFYYDRLLGEKHVYYWLCNSQYATKSVNFNETHDWVISRAQKAPFELYYAWATFECSCSSCNI